MSWSTSLSWDIEIMRLMRGFTLIELMIIVMVIAVLAAMAVPAYTNYTTRAKISEGINSMSSVKVIVAEAFSTSGMQGVAQAAMEFDGIPPTFDKMQSYYVLHVYINPPDGVISVTTTGVSGRLPDDALYKSITLVPNIGGHPLADGLSGPISWGCSSQTHNAATEQGIQIAPDQIGTLDPKYAPSNCR